MARIDGRKAGDLRPVRMTRGFTSAAPGSVLIETGATRVLCTATLEEGVPPWLEGKGRGWCTAEYDMLPGSTSPRKRRSRQKLDGRTQEIQRLIGRSLRAVLDLTILGERSLLIDCDVIQADGGTRTASITGAYVAAMDAVRAGKQDDVLTASPFVDSVAAVSVGVVDGKVLLDLNYVEDSSADVDLNLVCTGKGEFVELQGTGERTTFSMKQLERMLTVGRKGIRMLMDEQQKALRRRK